MLSVAILEVVGGEREREREAGWKDGERREWEGKKNGCVFVCAKIATCSVCVCSRCVCFSNLDHCVHSASVSSGQRSLHSTHSLE